MFENLIKWIAKTETNRSGILATPTALVVDITGAEDLPEAIDHRTWQRIECEGQGPLSAVGFLLPGEKDVLVTVVDILRDMIAARILVPNDALGEFSANFLRVPNGELTSSRTLLSDPIGTMVSGIIVNDRPPRPPKLEAATYRALARELYRTQRVPVIFTDSRGVAGP
jgi:hypothetical protein